MVNQAIQEMITNDFGTEKWQEVLQKSGVKEEFFLSNTSYDDAITYQLAFAATEVLGLSLKEVLNLFGEYWVMNTGMKKYGSIMTTGGTTLKEFIVNLPAFHNRVSLIYPNLNPPEFMVSDETENSIHLHYYSTRPGLTEFMRGLLKGLSKIFGKETTIEIIESRENGKDHDEFKISW